MRYNTPELVLVGTAASLVQGIPPGTFDNGQVVPEQEADGIAMGLDD
jgi:hypothetical protein